MTQFQNLKLAALAVCIGIGVIAQTNDARALTLETLTVAGGCFWCVEADFESVRGVTEVVSGYTGGTVANPTYKQVTRGGTGHYEAVQIQYDPNVVSADDLLSLFFRSIDPTDAGGQFCDRGSSYRTAIFADTGPLRTKAKAARDKAEADLGQKVVTPILPSAPFYKAEAYHQDFYKQKGIILTRFGPKAKSEAYKAYRDSCNRDETIRSLWGEDAPFAGS